MFVCFFFNAIMHVTCVLQTLAKGGAVAGQVVVVFLAAQKIKHFITVLQKLI